MPASNKSHKKSAKGQPARWHRGDEVPEHAIREFARLVAEKFRPQRIVLFGSHVQGHPHRDSDVDVLVIMRTRNQLDQAVKISQAIDPPFALDILVRTPHNVRWRIAEGDSFLQEVLSQGKVLYEAPDDGVGAQSRSRLSRGRRARPPKGKTA